MKLFRKSSILALSGIVVAAALGLSACSSTTTATPTKSAEPMSAAQCVASGTTSLNVSFGATATPSIKAAVQATEAKFAGLKINAVQSSAANYTENAQQIIADKAAGKDVDVAQIGNDQVRLFADTYGLAPYNTSLLPKDFDTQYLPVGQVNGKQFAVPFQISLPTMYINSDDFRAAGLDPTKPPKTIADLLTTARTLKAKGHYAQVVGINSGPSSDDFYLQSMIQSYGGTFTAPDGTAAFNSAAGVKALDFYSTAAKEGLLQHKLQADTLAAFEAGQIPILILSSASVQVIDTSVGNKFKWDVSLMPTTGKPSYTAGGNSLIALSSDPCRTAVADAFIAEMVSPSILSDSLKAYPYQPVNTTLRKSMLTSSTVNPKAKVMLKVETTFTPRGDWPGTHTPEVQQIFADMVENIVAGSSVKSEVKAGVAKIDAAVR